MDKQTLQKQIKNSLWRLGLSPLIWAKHFLFTYIAFAIACAKGNTEDFFKVRSVIAIVSLVAVVIIVREIVIAYRKHKLGNSKPPHDSPTPHDRVRFLGLSRLLISSLSLLAIIYTTYVVWFFEVCR